MKTSKSVSRKIETAAAGLTLAIMTTFFFSSCQKDETPLPASTQTATVNEKQISPLMQAPLRTVFALIKINHLAAPGAAEYSVTLYSNGSGFYEGKSNVALKGTRKFEASRKTLSVINELCKQFTAQGHVAIDVDRLMCLQVIETIYEANDDRPVRVFRDYNDGSNPKLEAFRNQIEKELKISRFTKHDKSLAEVAPSQK